MSEIDWDSMKGSTHYVPGWGLFKCENGEWFTEDRGVWRKTPYASPENFSWFGAAIKRPSDWSGDGLPPVGTYIEWLSDQYGWLGGRVVGHDGMVTVVSHNDGYTGCHAHEIRPIRTPEQIAAEERESAINGMLCYDALGGTRRGLAEALYDAGYRKVEP